MTEGDAPVQWSETDATPRLQLEDMTMLKKTLIAAAALASLALFAAPQAEAGYKHGHGWKYGGGCVYLTKPVTSPAAPWNSTCMGGCLRGLQRALCRHDLRQSPCSGGRLRVAALPRPGP